MKTLSGLLLFMWMFQALAQSVQSVSSPAHRVALLELYTSEGCSSCPPADRWLSKLKQSSIDSTQLVALAFHVTYWDYIGWRDRFAQKKFDQRQRELARHNASRTVYTPQFVLNGRDFRDYRHFVRHIERIRHQPSVVDLTLTLQLREDAGFDVQLEAKLKNTLEHVADLYLAVVENGLSSEVDDGENAGESLQHDYVVRRLYGPLQDSRQASHTVLLRLQPQWQVENLQLVGFAQNAATGEVLQAVRMAWTEGD